MAHRPWVVFGLDGRSENDVMAAVRLGYRRFDAAESYGTTEALAAAVRAARLPRRDYEVLYKFDLRQGESSAQLTARLTETADAFDGRLDAAVIHNLGDNPARVQEAWNVLHGLKRAGKIGKAGVGNVLPEHAGMLKQLQDKSSIDVVDLSPRSTPYGSRGGSQTGSPGTSRKGSPKGSDRSSPLLGVVENSVRGALADPDTQQLLASLGEKTTLYYYNVVRTLAEIQKHYDKAVGGALDLVSQHGMTAVAQQVGYRVDGPAHMIATSGNPETMRRNLKTFDADPLDPAFTDYPPVEYDRAITDWATFQDVCTRNDETPLPDGLRGKLEILFAHPDTERAQAQDFAEKYAGKVDGESLSTWLIQERGFTREELEGVTVPDRVGLLPAYQNMKLADVLAGHLGTQNCNHKWAAQLGYPLLHDASTWKAVGPELGEIAKDVDRLRTPSPVSMSDVAAMRSGNTSPAPHVASGNSSTPTAPARASSMGKRR